MEDIKDTILSDVINNKKFEIELKLDFYLSFLKRDKCSVEETINEMKRDRFFYREHSEFLDDFEKFGEMNFIKEYINFCNKFIFNDNQTFNELCRVANDKKIKRKFKNHLIKKTNKQLEKLKKCFIKFCEDENYYELQKKISEMEKMKKDIEYDIENLKFEITPNIFPDLEKRVEEYKVIAEDKKYFFSNLFDSVLEYLDNVDDKISKLYLENYEKAGILDSELSKIYIEYYECLDDYIEKRIGLYDCEQSLEDMKKNAKKINQKIYKNN